MLRAAGRDGNRPGWSRRWHMLASRDRQGSPSPQLRGTLGGPMASRKIRLDDGSEVGPIDVDMVQTWFQQGLLTRESLVQRPGSTRWVRLAEAVDLSKWRAPQGGGAARAGGA